MKKANQINEIVEKIFKPSGEYLKMLQAQLLNDTLKVMQSSKPAERHLEMLKAQLLKDTLKVIKSRIESVEKLNGQNFCECHIQQSITEEVVATLKDKGYEVSPFSSSREDRNTGAVIIRW